MPRKRDRLIAAKPEDYTALVADAPPPATDIPNAVARWRSLPLGVHVMCARGRVWRVASVRPHKYAEQYSDGTQGRLLDQPWYPLICASLPVWPMRIVWPRVPVPEMYAEDAAAPG